MFLQDASMQSSRDGSYGPALRGQKYKTLRRLIVGNDIRAITVFEGKDGFLLVGLESTYGTFATVSLGAPAPQGRCAQNPLFPVRELPAF
jgi:hypothetical protein